MRKAVIAAAAGLLLVAGQAAAAGSNTAVARIADRVGARADGAQDQFFAGVPFIAAAIGTVVVVTAVYVAVEEGDGESD